MNYYRRYPGDYGRDTMHLSMLEHGAYTLLLDASYATGKALPAAYEALNRICRAMTRLEQEAVKSIADQFFPVGEDGLRRNPRADREIRMAQATIERQRESGVESSRNRWSTDRSTYGSTHESTGRSAIQPPYTNHQPPDTKNQPPGKSKGGGRKRPCVPMPEGFGISERVRTWAAQKGFGELERHLEHFRGKAIAKSYVYADWDEGFMGAIRDDWAGVRANGSPADVDKLIREVEEEDRKRAAH